MKVTVYILTIMTLAFGWRHANSDDPANHDNLLSKRTRVTAEINLTNNYQDTSKKWTAPLIKKYINHSNNKLVKLAVKERISELWLFDQTIQTDTAKYFVFQIGHDVTDKGETNKRFITDSWVYIDSLTKTIYEYDLQNDRLIKWNN